MDVRFLESTCEAYIIDNNLFNEVSVEDLFKDIYKTLYQTKECDIELYNEVQSYSKLNQQKLIKEYFDLSYTKEIILEDGGLSLFSAFGIFGIGLAVLGTFRKPLSKALFNFLSGFSKTLDKVGKFLSKGRYWKFRYAIIQKNLKRAYIKCDVDQKDISMTHFLNIKDKPSSIPFTNDYKSIKQAHCLRDVYLDSLIKKISLLLKSYFVCLKRTGGFQKIENLDNNELMAIIATTNMSNSCEEYFVLVRETLNDFEELIDIIFEDKSNKQKMINKLMTAIGSAKKEIRYTKNVKKYR